MLSNLVNVTVPNWEKYNPRSDRTPSWFRFQNNFYSDDKLFDLTNNDRHVLLMIFCAVSSSSGGSAVVSLSKIAATLKISIDEVSQTIARLEDELKLLVTEKTDLGTKRNQTEPNGSTTYVRTDERTNTTTIKKTQSNFSEIGKQKEEAWGVWNETLESFGIHQKKISPADERILIQAINSLGFDRVLNALEGRRHKADAPNFKPPLSLDYCLGRNNQSGKSNHEELENLALAARSKKQSKMTDEELDQIATGMSR